VTAECFGIIISILDYNLSANHVKTFPNPTNSHFIVQIKDILKDLFIKITNALGQEIKNYTPETE